MNSRYQIIYAFISSFTCFEFEMSKYCNIEQWFPMSLSIASEQTFLTTNDVKEDAEVSTFRKRSGSILSKKYNENDINI